MAQQILAALSLLYLLSSACLASASNRCNIPPAMPPPKAKNPPAMPPPKAKIPPAMPPSKAPTANCPKDTLKLGVCADLLGLVNPTIGTPPDSKCCALLDGLTDLEAAVCLCTAIKANVLGVLNLDLPVAITLPVNACGKKVPDGFKCA